VRAAQSEDLGASLVALQSAAEGGHRGAQTELAALVGNWRLAGALATAKSKAGPQTWRNLRGAVDIAAWLSLPQGAALSASPRIAIAPSFLSPGICDWLIRLGRPYLKVAQTYDPESGAIREETGRSNSAAELGGGRMDTVLAFVRARIARLADLPVRALESTQLLHYEVGQEFRAHHDYFDVSFPGYAREVAERGQRALTVLVYLNEDYAGGDTAFPVIGRSFKGRKGDALIFWNVTDDGAPDPNTLHIGTAPMRGEKWLLSQWMRVKAK
jgi:prolyl 4-hydroxylase